MVTKQPQLYGSAQKQQMIPWASQAWASKQFQHHARRPCSRGAQNRQPIGYCKECSWWDCWGRRTELSMQHTQINKQCENKHVVCFGVCLHRFLPTGCHFGTNLPSHKKFPSWFELDALWRLKNAVRSLCKLNPFGEIVDCRLVICLSKRCISFGFKFQSLQKWQRLPEPQTKRTFSLSVIVFASGACWDGWSQGALRSRGSTVGRGMT